MLRGFYINTFTAVFFGIFFTEIFIFLRIFYRTVRVFLFCIFSRFSDIISRLRLLLCNFFRIFFIYVLMQKRLRNMVYANNVPECKNIIAVNYLKYFDSPNHTVPVNG